MKKSISISVGEEKLSAIEMYLEQKNTTLAAELDKYVEQLYQKNVPQNVRDYIEMISVKKPATQFAPCAIVRRFYGMGGELYPKVNRGRFGAFLAGFEKAEIG